MSDGPDAAQSVSSSSCPVSLSVSVSHHESCHQTPAGNSNGRSEFPLKDFEAMQQCATSCVVRLSDQLHHPGQFLRDGTLKCDRGAAPSSPHGLILC